MSSELLGVILNTFYVSAVPTLLAVAVGTPAAYALYARGGRLAGAVEALFNGLVGMPTVLLGLLLYLLLARTGPLGFLNILYTLNAVVVGHFLFVLPLYVAFATTAFRSVDVKVLEVLRMFPMPAWRRHLLVVREAIGGLAAAAAAAFSRAMGELGIALMLGGDIRFRTRVLTTAIAHETMLGNWDVAIQLGIILLILSVSVSVVVYALGYKYRG
ncbi:MULTISPECIES: ABC transporter permease [Pyrobaculum]|uniref:Binding-protein-dependent transport systems inner membrane component n=2 Tax=Pyrobaculum arsenaticum TaxID=121277 RepID=A4WIL8_PYRAR|nr:ABC transporter permease [Pyrobaculum arsenaticum]ABP50235.1 binding-protein-dependent transport systems inner membrane component [Pyrobaculum arsenaticum DSM 13514]MCY0889869.1 ABC transporter permease [Pyrobaculum arsenaticum]NYR14828.1 ABC transporter permease [Pyrobaculum arsenaticum]